MFTNKTVFILGAGASWHYGYPTGEDLVRAVREKAQQFRTFCADTVQRNDLSAIAQVPEFLKRKSPGGFTDGYQGMKRAWEDARDESGALFQRLASVDPVVIDYFLGHNPDLQEIGKFMIAWVLLEREALHATHQCNENRCEAARRSPSPSEREKANNARYWQHFMDNWYRFLVHKLAVGCLCGDDLLSRNDVTFVTFNYDVSLERELYRALSAISLFATDGIVPKFFGNQRVLHIYGRIREAPLDEPTPFDLDAFSGGASTTSAWVARKKVCDAAYQASLGIRTIAPDEKTSSEEVSAARKAIHAAACVYILGYGFDQANNCLLELHNAVRDNGLSRRYVLFTNFGDAGAVNKRASLALTMTPGTFLQPGPIVHVARNSKYSCEKSVRNVYDALSLDFDSPEERPLPLR